LDLLARIAGTLALVGIALGSVTVFVAAWLDFRPPMRWLAPAGACMLLSGLCGLAIALIETWR
jgi:uncharacterized membrane protein YgdD (TMEM256/DUF423 family)